jgi:two-component system NtrC family sensor kinase
MTQNRAAQGNKFMESERIFIELSSLTLSRVHFLHSISNQFKLLSDCAALEIRAFDRELEYRWFTDFDKQTRLDEVQFISDEKSGKIPVLPDKTPMEEICRDLFRKRYDPLLQYEYGRQSVYIEDTSATVSLTSQGIRKEVDLSGTGNASILFLSFAIHDNPPGLLILYGGNKQFINKADVSAYEELMHSLSIALKFRRSLFALNERIKELSCLYEINLIFQDYADEPEILLQKIVEHIPKAFQYAQSACALIEIGKLKYTSEKYTATGNHLASFIELEGKTIGNIRVFYPEFSEAEEPMHFLPEEQKLLDIISQKVSLVYGKVVNKREKQAIEEQLLHADRLATIGQLGSGIAHELNDPLANILGYAQLLLKAVKEPSQLADLERIVRSSLHAREIVRKLLLFARQMPTRKSKVNLNKIITDTLDLLKSRLEQGKVKLETDLDPSLPMIDADPSQMTQMVTNLSVNAMQAMPQGGRIEISTKSGKNAIVLTVKDTGSGIEEELLEKIFLPFFTTKPIGVGTGLGLSVVHGIITSHNGTIEVQSKAGKGSTFTVTLPFKASSRE